MRKALGSISAPKKKKTKKKKKKKNNIMPNQWEADIKVK
jgi:hypothetical protein